MRTKKIIAALVCVLALSAATMVAIAQETAPPTTPPTTQAAAPTTEERVAAIKGRLAQSMQNLKEYQWTETQVINLKGEDKSNKQFACSHGADGKIVKTPVAAPAEEKGKPGLRGRVVENKKEEMGEYVQSAVALVKSYIPPDPAKIQAAKDAGNVSMTPLAGGKSVRVDFKDYEKPGDNLGVEVDMTTNQILGLSVASYLADAKDAVTLDVKMASLADGTDYPATIVLDGKSKAIKVTVNHSDYKKKVVN
jgi:hypothetical protein